jgi:hypothetical protein
MKISEFKKLIREEVRKVLKEAGDPSLGYGAIEYFMDSDDGKSSAKYAKENSITNADIVASFQSGEWKSGSFVPKELANFVSSLKMSEAEIDTIATALKYNPKQVEALKSALGNMGGKAKQALEPLIGGMYEQFDDFKIAPSLVNIEISPLANAGDKLFSILEKNKNKLSSFFQANGLPSCKLFYATSTAGFGGSTKIVITSKPRPASYLKVKKEVQL